jgi:hypothetical protein
VIGKGMARVKRMTRHLPRLPIFSPLYNKYKTRFADIMIVNAFMEGLTLASEIA